MTDNFELVVEHSAVALVPAGLVPALEPPVAWEPAAVVLPAAVRRRCPGTLEGLLN